MSDYCATTGLGMSWCGKLVCPEDYGRPRASLRDCLTVTSTKVLVNFYGVVVWI